MKKIVIIGAGAMGSAFAVPCLDNKNDVTNISADSESYINSIVNNSQFGFFPLNL